MRADAIIDRSEIKGISTLEGNTEEKEPGETPYYIQEHSSTLMESYHTKNDYSADDRVTVARMADPDHGLAIFNIGLMEVIVTTPDPSSESGWRKDGLGAFQGDDIQG